MTLKEESEKALKIIGDFKNQPNKELIFVLEFIKKDFEFTKNSLIKFSEHLDKLENTYNLILKEYQNRTK